MIIFCLKKYMWIFYILEVFICKNNYDFIFERKILKEYEGNVNLFFIIEENF